jgi:hypothetical protein
MIPVKSKPKLHVLFARESKAALVIRRGPAMLSCTVGWDRRDDRFTMGQWLKGRIYERRSDLSPDGRYFIYFAMNGRKRDSPAKGSWTAISRAPYLHAITLLAKGDTWHGGGLFTGRNRYWLNNGYGHEVLRESRELTREAGYQPSSPLGNSEDLGVYYARLSRDGWKYIESREAPEDESIDVFEKRFDKRWVLRKLAGAGGPRRQGVPIYHDAHELIHADGRVFPFPRWEWAEADGKRLVWAEDGKLFAGRPGYAKLEDIVELHDFNDYKFEPIRAPYDTGEEKE